MEHGHSRTGELVTTEPGCKHATAPALHPEEGMEVIEIEGETDRTLLARGGQSYTRYA